MHLPCHVQAAEVVGHQGGRLHPLQGVGALVLAAGGGCGGCGHLQGHLVGQAAGGGGHLLAVYWLGVQGGRLHPLQGVGALVLAGIWGGDGYGHLQGHLVGQAAGWGGGG